MVTWSHDHHMIHHIRQRSLFDRFACMVNKIKCETYLPESQVVIWFITSSKIICDLINLRSGEWVMVLHSIWCYCHMCNHDIIYFVHILCSRAASKWLLLSGMTGRSNQSESNDSIDFIWILGHQMMSLHMIPETTFAVSILSVTLMADKALQHMWDGENQLLVSFKSWPFENLWHEMLAKTDSSLQGLTLKLYSLTGTWSWMNQRNHCLEKNMLTANTFLKWVWQVELCHGLSKSQLWESDSFFPKTAAWNHQHHCTNQNGLIKFPSANESTLQHSN